MPKASLVKCYLGLDASPAEVASLIGDVPVDSGKSASRLHGFLAITVANSRVLAC